MASSCNWIARLPGCTKMCISSKSSAFAVRMLKSSVFAVLWLLNHFLKLLRFSCIVYCIYLFNCTPFYSLFTFVGEALLYFIQASFFLCSLGTFIAHRTESTKLCQMLGSEPHLEMPIQNLGSPPLKIVAPKLPRLMLDRFSTTSRRNREHLRNKTRAGKRHWKPQNVPYIFPKLHGCPQTAKLSVNSAFCFFTSAHRDVNSGRH